MRVALRAAWPCLVQHRWRPLLTLAGCGLVTEGVRPGQLVSLGAVPYQVVGVLSPQGVNFAGEDEDRQAFIPLDAYRRRVANRPWLNHLYLQLERGADSAAIVRQVDRVLRERH